MDICQGGGVTSSSELTVCEQRLEIQFWYPPISSFMRLKNTEDAIAVFWLSRSWWHFSQNLSVVSFNWWRGKGKECNADLTVWFWNICIVPSILALEENVPCHQLNPNLLLGNGGRTLSVGHHFSVKKNTKPNLKNPSMCYKYRWTTSWVAGLQILKSIISKL